MPSVARRADDHTIAGPVIATRPTPPSAAVTHHACKTQTRSAALTAGSPPGNTCDVNGALLHKLSMPVNEPIHKHTGLSEPYTE